MQLPSRRRSSRLVPVLAVMALGALVLTGCLSSPGDVSQIELVSSTTVNGWHYDFYRNRAYPCAISGYQTFAIGTKVGSDTAATAPLWVKMHGGGVGWFDAAGNPQPTSGQKTEEGQAKLVGYVDAGLTTSIMNDPAGFRVLVVSMCSHDLYAGDDTPDPNNPHTEPDGTPVTTNGLYATKAAVAFTLDHYPTDDYFLHGTSAGGAGTWHVAWSLQQQGIPPTGLVSDSGVMNQAWEHAQNAQSGPCARGEDNGALILDRMAPDIANPANQPDLLVRSGRLKVPVMNVWNIGDKNTCGDTPMECPLPDGSTATMWSSMCEHEPMRLAVASLGANSRSKNLGVCVDDPNTVAACDVHVVTSKPNVVNTQPGIPAHFLPVIVDWVHARMADD